MKRFIEGEERSQITLLPECLDDYIAEDNPVRVVDVFVDELQGRSSWALEGAQPAATGRPSYHPAVLLKLYIYGYLNQVPVEPTPGARSAAQRRAHVADRPPGAGLQDHRRLPQGPRRGPSASMCASSCCCAVDCKLFADGIVAIDGSKFKAVNNREDKNFTNHKIEVRMRPASSTASAATLAELRPR